LTRLTPALLFCLAHRKADRGSGLVVAPDSLHPTNRTIVPNVLGPSVGGGEEAYSRRS